MNEDNTHLTELLLITYRLLRYLQTKCFIKLELMRIRNGLMPSSKCVISIGLGLESLSWIGAITKTPSNIGSLTISGSGLTTSLISPMLKVDADRGIGGSSDSKAFFIGSRIWRCVESLFYWPNCSCSNVTFQWIYLASTMMDERKRRKMRSLKSLKWISGSGKSRRWLITLAPSIKLGWCH